MKEAFAAFENVGLPACAVDEHQRIVGWNQSASDFFRVEAESAIGREWHTVVHTVQTPGCCALCRTRRALRTGDMASPVDTTLSIDGYYERVTMVPMPMSSGMDTVIGFLVLNPDMAGQAAPRPMPIPIQSRVRHLDNERMIDELTPREREVLACVVEGNDARTIAATVGISHATARNYVQRILSKLGVRNKAEAVNVALTYNLLAS